MGKRERERARKKKFSLFTEWMLNNGHKTQKASIVGKIWSLKVYVFI